MKLANVSRILSAAILVNLMGFAGQAASTPVITEAKDVCNAKLIQFVDTPATVVFDASGNADVEFASSNSLDVGNCRHFYFEISSSAVTGYDVIMGKISNATLAEIVMSGSAQGHIQSLEIKGPEIRVALHGAPKTKGDVQM